MNSEWFSSQKGLKNIIVLFFGLASLFLLILCIGTVRSWSERETATADRPTIVVSGMGDATGVPDIAQFSFTVSEVAKTVQEAQNLATTKNNAALDYLKKNGIADKDYKTTSYNVSPKTEYEQTVCLKGSCPVGKEVLVGYSVSQTTDVKVRDTAKAGTILGGIGALGVQNVSDLQLTFDKPDTLNDQARKNAILDAKTKAEVLAQELGVHLVRIVSFSEDGSRYPMAYAAAGKAMDSVASQSAPTQIATGETKVTSNVTVTYEIR